MPLLKKSDLRYDYSWEATPGDDPKLVKDDSQHLSRTEGYEILLYLNNLGFSDDKTKVLYGQGSDMAVEHRLYVEWMLKEHYESTAPSRATVTKWVNENWRPLKKVFKELKPKKVT